MVALTEVSGAAAALPSAPRAHAIEAQGVTAIRYPVIGDAGSVRAVFDQCGR
jgi:hypothetical protein